MMEKITFDNNDDEKSQKPIYLDEKSNDDINSHGDNPNKDSHNFTGPTKENTGNQKKNIVKKILLSQKKRRKMKQINKMIIEMKIILNLCLIF